MKKKSLLTLSVVGLMTFGVVSCGGGESNQGLKDAADYVWQLYKNESASQKTVSMANYDVVTKVIIEGVEYGVDWAVTTNGGVEGAVKLGAADKGKQAVDIMYDPIKSTAATEYTLTATITDAKGNKEVKSFERIVPAFEFSTWKDISNPKKGKVYNVKGVITATEPYSAEYKNVGKIFIQNDEFGIMGYRMKAESAEAAKNDLKVGNEIIISGEVKRYNGQIEFDQGCTYMVASTTAKELKYVDATKAFTDAKDAKDVNALDKYQNRLVELKGVKVGAIDEENHYYYLTIGNNETYLRTSTKMGLSEKDNAKLLEEWVPGYIADVKGVCVVYSGIYYIQPIAMDNVKITERVLTDDVKAANAIKDVEDLIPANVVTTREITLPAKAANEQYNTVTYAWSVVEGSNFVIEGGKLKVTVGDTAAKGKIKVVATSGDKTAEKVFEVTAALPETTKIGTFVTDAANKDSQFVRGVVVAAAGSHDRAGSFVLADETGSVFSYNKFKVEVGDEVIISTKRALHGDFVQSGTEALEGILSSGNSIDTYLANAQTYADIATLSAKLATFADDKAMFEGLQGKPMAITGLVKKTDKGFAMYASADAKDYVVNIYANDTLKESLKDGQVQTITGFLRGVKAENGQITIQVTTVA